MQLLVVYCNYFYIAQTTLLVGGEQYTKIIDMVDSDRKTASEAARIFKVHPATIISRLLMQMRHKSN